LIDNTTLTIKTLLDNCSSCIDSELDGQLTQSARTRFEREFENKEIYKKNKNFRDKILEIKKDYRDLCSEACEKISKIRLLRKQIKSNNDDVSPLEQEIQKYKAEFHNKFPACKASIVQKLKELKQIAKGQT